MRWVEEQWTFWFKMLLAEIMIGPGLLSTNKTVKHALKFVRASPHTTHEHMGVGLQSTKWMNTLRLELLGPIHFLARVIIHSSSAILTWIQKIMKQIGMQWLTKLKKRNKRGRDKENGDRPPGLLAWKMHRARHVHASTGREFSGSWRPTWCRGRS